MDLEPRVLGIVNDELQAMELAEDVAGARPSHWVNRGMVDQEYKDYVRDGRRTIAPERGGQHPATDAAASGAEGSNV